MLNQQWLGRRYARDDRDQKFLMARKLGPVGAPMPVSKTWSIAPKSLDQGATGTCVGHAWFNFARCEPIQTAKMQTPYQIYRDAIAIDEWTDNDHEVTLPDNELQSGTSVRAGAKVMMKYGRLKSYMWAFNMQHALEFVLTQGPVVLGVNWYSSFDRPDKEGIVRITPTAQIEGGHSFLWRGGNTRRGLGLCEQTWGDWGIKGKFYISLRDIERLIHEDGEACTAIEQKVKPAP